MDLISKSQSVLLSWTLAAVGSLILSLILIQNWEAGQFSAEAGTTLSLEGYSYAETASDTGIRKISRKEGTSFAEYQVKNFNNDLVQIKFSMPTSQLEEYCKGYGYTQADLDSLLEWQKKALKDAYQYVVDHSQTQADLDRASANIKDEYRRKFHDLMVSRGFKYKTKGALAPDIPGIVKRNVQELSPVALDINNIAKAGHYDALDVVGATLALMQTGLEYESIPMKRPDRTTGGVYPPLEAIILGRGDCDSKTALMASILLNWDKAKLIGVGIPNHYLIGVLRTPAKGDAYVEYEGLNYMLMEPAGPGRLVPGVISEHTLEVLNARDQVSLEPLQKN